MDRASSERSVPSMLDGSVRPQDVIFIVPEGEDNRDHASVSPAPSAAVYDVRTQDVSLLISDDFQTDQAICEKCAVPLMCRILIAFLTMIPCAAVGFLLGWFIPFFLVPLQWSLFMGTALDGFQNVDAVMYLLRTGKRLKSPKSEWCKHLKCSKRNHRNKVWYLIKLLLTPVIYLLRFIFGIYACVLAWLFGLILWCPLTSLVMFALVGAIVAYDITAGQARTACIYEAFERVLILLRLIKVRDDNKYKEGKSSGRRKLDGTWFFYLLLCSPFALGWCGALTAYAWVFFHLCAYNSSDFPYIDSPFCYFGVYLSASTIGCLILPLFTIGLYMLYRNRLNYLEENMEGETVEEEMAEDAEDGEEAVKFMDKYNEMLEKMQDFPGDVPLTEEETNWVRLSFLLVEEGTVWVAKIIGDDLRSKGLKFQQLLDANRASLQQFTKGQSVKQGRTKGKEAQKLFTSEQFDLLFPADGEADLATVDLTLLVLLIGLLRVLPEPPCKWNAKVDPPATETDTSSDLVRMRLMRNHLYAHIVECAIGTEDFEVHWDKLLGILTRMGAEPQELDKIKQRDVTKDQRKQLSKTITTLFSGDLPDAEEFAVERMKELAENHKMRLQVEELSDETRGWLFI